MDKSKDQICINTIRMLAIDMIEKANSGHPGMPLGAAPMAYVLWMRHLKHNPSNPKWFDRDRFVLSAGHGSALLYSLLHLTGYDLPLSELEQFRQWGSLTPGHPEHGLTPGVETTTGPLGQGFANAVGMALAEHLISEKFNRAGFTIVDHHTYVIASDGDLMEGVASEAASLAGHLKLGKLICLYDDNHITIEGDTKLTFTEDVCKRFEAYGWHIQRVEDGNDIEAIDAAIVKAKFNCDKPSLISIRTHIGFGSPKQDTAAVHGEPLGPEGVAKTKEFFGWPKDKQFYVPDEALAVFRQAIDNGRDFEDISGGQIEKYRAVFLSEYEKFETWLSSKPPLGWDARIPVFDSKNPVATRDAGGKTMSEFALEVENFFGGSADLSPSTKTLISGRNIHYGLREHAMGAITNGLALHGGIIPFCSTFLVFSDYMRPAIRLSALMKTHSIFVFTHDSVGLGEDGPTHQPVEHLASLRAIPGLTVIRPADANETAAAWRVAMEHEGPVALILTRQKIPVLDTHLYPVADGVRHGAYILSDCGKKCDAIIIATGSEVQLALAAQKKLKMDKIFARVVSMPSWELFEKETGAYKEKVLPRKIKNRISIEAGATVGWCRYVGDKGLTIGLDRFGASAPEKTNMDKLGFSADALVLATRRTMRKK